MLGKMPVSKAVSIHTPTKGVTAAEPLPTLPLAVSIHTPTKGVTKVYNYLLTTFLCFNPHTHEGCDFQIGLLKNIIVVSIHTPTKGVTYF